MAPTPLTVGQLSRRLKAFLEGEFARVRVLGELSKVFVSTRGHVYLTLKDEASRVECVVYASTVRTLAHRPDEGSLVLVEGDVSFYEPRGTVQLVVTWIEPAGQGRLQAAFDALKAQLLTEGLFAPERKRALPFLPRAVGVVTSAVGAARRDIEAVIQRRSPQIPIVISPCTVEGVDAAPDIVRALKVLGRRPDVDVIIVGRGGGSLESLWAFNTEMVARAIAACPKPVISAVGHETDTTIADLVADRRAPTPSAAAELAVPERDALLYTLALQERRLARALEARVERAGRRLERAVSRLEASTRARIVARRRSLEVLRRRLAAAEPGARLARSRGRLEGAQARLHRAGERRLVAAREALSLALARLEALSPLSVLARGYSITRQGGRVVRRFDAVVAGDELEILLETGRLQAVVTGRSGPGEEG
ncbi:MAG: exodeoxyribonuclease VII large subunit [Myxococcales bacterium]|nr:exodeoxyribonuclease VII large subunit [Myxococcales bacterium]